MKQVNKLVEDETYRQSIGYKDIPTHSNSKSQLLKEKRRWQALWVRLGEIYGHQLTSQYGETMPETWRRLLKEFSSTDLKRGLQGLLKRQDKWPPNAIEFRNMCLKNSHSHAKNHTAYIDFNDPEHPDYQAPRIESDEMKSERETTGKAALDQMKEMFR